MRVAIIGAGIAGLCCAYELEKHGITPEIFEKNSFIGEAYPHVTASIGLTHRTAKDLVKLYKSYGMTITPLNTIKTMVHISPHNTAPIKGRKLGNTFLYTRGTNSLKQQLYSQLKNPHIHFNQLGDYELLKNEYDHVVIATGTPQLANELGVFQPWLNTYVRGSMMLGEFDVNTLTMWLNKDYCKNGYAYMTVYNKNKASLVLVVTDVNEREVDNYWDLFISSEGLRQTIVEEFKIKHDAGFVYPLILDNMIFAGTSAGGIDPFLGFGHLNAVTMGVAAARTIATGKDYYKQIRKIIKANIHMRNFRKSFDVLTNKDYDNILSFIKAPIIKQVFYNSPINMVPFISRASQYIKKASKD